MKVMLQPMGAATVILAGSLVVGCLPSETELTQSERNTIAASVDSATGAFRTAQMAQEAERAIAHLAPDFYMYVDGSRMSYDSVVSGIRNTLPAFRSFDTQYDAVEVTVLSRTSALVSFTFRDVMTTASGETLRARGSTALLWRRRGDDWRIAYAHADHLPDSLP